MSSSCDRCLTPPRPFTLPWAPAGATLPASVAWLRSQNPAEFVDRWRKAGAAAAAQAEPRTDGVLGSSDARVFLSTVLLALAATRRIELFDVNHRAGWMSRLFGKSQGPAICVSAVDTVSESRGVVESRVLEAVRRSDSPHGLSVMEIVGALCPALVANPGLTMLQTAKESGVSMGVGRFVPMPPLPETGTGFLNQMIEKVMRDLLLYEILPSHQSAVAAGRAGLEALRGTVGASDGGLLQRLEAEIEMGLRERTSVD